MKINKNEIKSILKSSINATGYYNSLANDFGINNEIHNEYEEDRDNIETTYSDLVVKSNMYIIILSLLKNGTITIEELKEYIIETYDEIFGDDEEDEPDKKEIIINNIITDISITYNSIENLDGFIDYLDIEIED